MKDFRAGRCRIPKRKRIGLGIFFCGKARRDPQEVLIHWGDMRQPMTHWFLEEKSQVGTVLAFWARNMMWGRKGSNPMYRVMNSSGGNTCSLSRHLSACLGFNCFSKQDSSGTSKEQKETTKQNYSEAEAEDSMTFIKTQLHPKTYTGIWRKIK